MTQQWNPHRSVGCRVPVWREKKQNNTWRSATFQYHLACGTSQRGGRREAAFINVALYRIRYGCAALGHLTLPMCPELPLSQMCLRRCSWRGWVSSTLEQMCAFDLDSSGVICTERPGQGQRLKLKQLLNSQFIGFHNMRGLRNKGVRVSSLDDWTGMSSSQQCVLMGLFWKLNIWCDGWVLLTGMCQYLPSPCWSLMIIYVAGCSKSDGSLKMYSRAVIPNQGYIYSIL